MGYLKSASEVALACGITSGGSSAVQSDPKFLAMLAGSTARISRMLETPLDRAGYTDTFELDSRFIRKNELFRLTAGFVDPASIVVMNSYGDQLNSDEYALSADKGVVTVFRPRGGRYTVRYNAGFISDNAPVPILQGTPEWLRSLADQAGLLWLRIMSMNPKASENVSFGDTMNVVYRELAGAAQNTYERPRFPAIWPLASSTGAPHVIA